MFVPSFFNNQLITQKCTFNFSCFFFWILFHHNMIWYNIINCINYFLHFKTYFMPYNIMYLDKSTSHVVENNMYYSVIEWNTVYICVKSIWCIVSFKADLCLLVLFCMDNVFFAENEVLKSLTIIILGVCLTFSMSNCLLWNSVCQHLVHIYF